MENCENNNEVEKQITLAQWQTCVEMANAVSQRRDTTNNLFVTLHLAVIGAITALSSFTKCETCIVCFLGIAFCFVWMKIIKNFKILNSEKYSVITELEKMLPNQPLTREWENIQKSHYKLGTSLERILPLIFLFIYVVLMIERFFC